MPNFIEHIPTLGNPSKLRLSVSTCDGSGGHPEIEISHDDPFFMSATVNKDTLYIQRVYMYIPCLPRPKGRANLIHESAAL